MTDKRFTQMAKAALLSIYFVILMGGIVRTTGSGMGCPDWPKCFGQWIPPTSETELPANYQEIYSHRGYADTTFNAFHTWTEYINRLSGAVAGLLIFATFVLSLKYWKKDRPLVLLCGFEFLLMGFQGWLGSVVVASNLEPAKITVHMITAIVIIAVLVYIIARAQGRITPAISINRKVYMAAIIAILLSAIQIIIGTQVRQEVDTMAEAQVIVRENWILHLGTEFYIHRSFSILVFLVNTYLAFLIITTITGKNKLKRNAVWLLIIILIELVSGVIMAYFAIPAPLQPVHLLLACIMFGLQFYILIKASEKKFISVRLNT